MIIIVYCQYYKNNKNNIIDEDERESFVQFLAFHSNAGKIAHE
jgi:hypothetical protein